MNESDFSRDVIRRVTSADSRIVGWKHSDQFSAGWPDITLIGPAGFIVVEHKLIKRTSLPAQLKPSLSEQQKARLRAIHAVQPTRTLVGVGIQYGRNLDVAVFDSPEQWDESVQLRALRVMPRAEYAAFLLSLLRN